MNIETALRILKESNVRLLCEFLGDSVSKYDMENRYLKLIIPDFNKSEDLTPNVYSPDPNERSGTAQTGEDDLISLEEDVLERHGLSLREFERRLKPYGWTVTGYTHKQVLIMPNRLGKSPEPNVKKPEALALINKCKGLYLRFDNREPSLIKRVGFRTTKDRYLNLDDPKRSKTQFWNQERVYVYSIEQLAKYTKGDPVQILYGIYEIVQSGMEYGRYLYLMKVPESIRFDRDLEYNGGKFEQIAGYLESNVHSSMIVKCLDTYSEECGKELTKLIGIDQFVKNKSILDKIFSSKQTKNNDDRVKVRNKERNFDVEEWD